MFKTKTAFQRFHDRQFKDENIRKNNISEGGYTKKKKWKRRNYIYKEKGWLRAWLLLSFTHTIFYVRKASAADISKVDDQAPEYQHELNRRLSEGRLSMIIRGDELQEDNCYNNFGKMLQNHTFHAMK